MAVLKVGAKAPVFSLRNQDDELVSLGDFNGQKNVVLYFYPKALTPGCTTQACGIRDTKDVFAELDTVVLGISPDPVARLQKFREKESLNFDLLSDEDHDVADKYGAWGLKKFMGKEYDGILRSTFIVDKNGRLRAHMPKVNTKSHHDEVIALIRESLC